MSENGCKLCGFRTTDAALETCPVCRRAMVRNLPFPLYDCDLCGTPGDRRLVAPAVWNGSEVHPHCVDPSLMAVEVSA